MKVIVAGSRDFKDYALLKEFLDKLVIFRSDFTEIVSGTASGADKLGERYAQEHNLAIKRFPADWEKYGKAAGIFATGRWLNTLMPAWCSGMVRAKGQPTWQKLPVN